MKLLTAASTAQREQRECAARVMEVVPLVMRWIRSDMQGRRMPGLSIPQFRTLLFLERNPGTSLSNLAEHLGLSLPSASKTIDRLVERKLVSRTLLPNDRRYVSLKVTAKGQMRLQATRRGTEARLTGMLSGVPPEQLAAVAQVMDTLRLIFSVASSRGSSPVP